MNTASTKAIDKITQGLSAPDSAAQLRAYAHLNSLTKPLGSLGRLEDFAAQIVAILQGRLTLPLNKGVYIFAADHGITAEGVSAYPREVTQQMVLNFLTHGAAVNVLSDLHHAQLTVIDVGVDAELPETTGLLHHKIARGTRNMLHEEAVTDAELARALTIGADVADIAASSGQTIIAVGEMGIGNTTAASAITCALIGAQPALATGKGTGLDAAAHNRKISIVQSILNARFGEQPTQPSPLEILRCVGGFEIAAITGMVLRAAHHKLVIIADGFISTAAVALSVAIAPDALAYVIAGHHSEEPGHRLLLEHLKLTPVLNLGMRLGEGSGAVLAMPILESAVALYLRMATFSAAGVSEAPR
jgi:nicotinate-nucleotide--dimethylbenzimidazole phosphoribosyltransferase